MICSSDTIRSFFNRSVPNFLVAANILCHPPARSGQFFHFTHCSFRRDLSQLLVYRQLKKSAVYKGRACLAIHEQATAYLHSIAILVFACIPELFEATAYVPCRLATFRLTDAYRS